MAEQLTDALQDYLGAIARLEGERRVARSRDIAREMGVQPSTVTAALRALSEQGMVEYAPYEPVTLTAEGRRRARRLGDRLIVLRHFLGDVLGLDAREAEANAARMMHALDDEALGRVVCFVAFVRGCIRAGKDWTPEFREFARGAAGSCDHKVAEYLRRFAQNEPDGF